MTPEVLPGYKISKPAPPPVAYFLQQNSTSQETYLLPTPPSSGDQMSKHMNLLGTISHLNHHVCRAVIRDEDQGHAGTSHIVANPWLVLKASLSTHLGFLHLKSQFLVEEAQRGVYSVATSRELPYLALGWLSIITCHILLVLTIILNCPVRIQMEKSQAFYLTRGIARPHWRSRETIEWEEGRPILNRACFSPSTHCICWSPNCQCLPEHP